ncbi:MAG TPA: hypothetical protein VG206_26415 [Terriglobia bacterium]|nr:hypothetical protein [Terriglobia bacterium]
MGRTSPIGNTLKEKWIALRIDDVKVQTNAAQHIFEAGVFLKDLDPSFVRVELYANGGNGSSPIQQEMMRVRPAGEAWGDLLRIGPGDPSRNGLYSAHHTELRRRCGAPGSRSHSLAAVNQPRTGERRQKTIHERLKKRRGKRQPMGPDAVRVSPDRKKVLAATDLTSSERTEVRMGVTLPMRTHQKWRRSQLCFFDRHASRVRLELFDRPQDAKAARVIDVDPARNRIGDVWHLWIEGIRPGQLYAYGVDGPPLAPYGYERRKTVKDILTRELLRDAEY